MGTEKGSSVREVCDTVETITGKQIKVETHPRRDGDAAILLANAERAKNFLGWKPTRTLEDSIKTAYLWEKSRH